MWPIMLDMTRDECRGVLRRLELEAYSNLMTTFRAQGNLNDKKTKILDELRVMFNISVDRHRAEARRVTNDEQLCTIADAVFGPNTMISWCREGRRPFPMFNRGTGYTAVTAAADEASECAKNKNSALSYPSETRRSHAEIEVSDITEDIIIKDPIIATQEIRANLKRSMSLANDSVMNSKKRCEPVLTDSNAISADSIQEQEQSFTPLGSMPLLLPTNTRIQQLYNTHSKIQVKHKKLTQTKRIKGSRFSSISINDKIENKKDKSFVVAVPRSAKTATTSMETENDLISSQVSSMVSPIVSSTTEGQLFTPQIATSKKDIASNLTKLNLTTPQQNVNVIYTTTPQQPIESAQVVKSQPSLTASTNKLSQQTLKMIPQPQFKLAQRTIQTSNTKMISSIVEAKSGGGLKMIQTKPAMQSNIITTPSPTISNAVPMLSPTPSLTNIISSAMVNLDGNIKFSKIATIAPSIDNSKATPKIITNIGGNLIRSTSQSGTPNPPKVQILNHQIIHSPKSIIKAGATAGQQPIKITAHNNFQLKTLQSTKSNQIKIIPTASGLGKVVIKPNINKLTSGSVQMKAVTPIMASTFQTNPTIATTPGSLQKVQLMPMKSVAGDTAKSNIYVVQKFNSISPANLRNVKFPKEMSKIIFNTKNVAPVGPLRSNQSGLSQNNVIVLGAINENKTDLHSKVIVQKNPVITEDTPVDILSTSTSPTCEDSATTEQMSTVNGNMECQQSQPETEIVTSYGSDNKSVNLSDLADDDKEIVETDWEVELDQQNATERMSRKEMQNNHAENMEDSCGSYEEEEEDEDFDVVEDYGDSVESIDINSGSDNLMLNRSDSNGEAQQNKSYDADSNNAAKKLYFELSHNSDDCIIEGDSMEYEDSESEHHQNTAPAYSNTTSQTKSNNPTTADIYKAAIASADVNRKSIEATKQQKHGKPFGTGAVKKHLGMDHVEALMIEMHEMDERGNRRLGHVMSLNDDDTIINSQTGPTSDIKNVKRLESHNVIM